MWERYAVQVLVVVVVNRLGVVLSSWRGHGVGIHVIQVIRIVTHLSCSCHFSAKFKSFW